MKEQWIYEQFSTIDVGDTRLQKRAVDVAIGCAEHPEKSLAGRFDMWADLQGAYRFFSNPKITHQALQQSLSAYEACLMYELRLRRLNVEHQKPLPIFYKNVILDCGYRLDIFVENQVIVEIKSVSGIAPIHEAQLLSYLKMSDYKRGLLINFNVTMLKDGLRRMRL